MVKRRNKRTGESFWGCPMYPQCDGTIPIEEPVQRGGYRYPEWARGKDSPQNDEPAEGWPCPFDEVRGPYSR